MTKLEAALAWAARGFKVFPLQENGKAPVHSTSWVNDATDDPAKIRATWTDPVLGIERNYNVGCACTGSVVIDIDTKNGKHGIENYAAIGGTYDTLVVQTPTGGYHCYYAGTDSSNAPIAEDVDVRSHNGYVVAPGSVIDGQVYTVVRDAPIAPVPPAIEMRLRSVHESRRTAADAAWNSDAGLEAARRYLESVAPAVEGQRGDDWTFQVAARLVRDMSLSTENAFHLMVELWNPRCQPPWPHEELWQKCVNAAQYGTASMGLLDPSVLFSRVQIDPPPGALDNVAASWGNALGALDLPPRPWIVDRMLMAGELTLLLAEGSAGKSSVSLAIAAHLAVGKDFGTHRTHVKCKSIVYNGEDDIIEQSRRLYAVCQLYQFDYDIVKRSITLLSADELNPQFVVSSGRQSIDNTPLIEAWVAKASDPDVGLIVLDPLVDVHGCDESDNNAMNHVMRTIRYVAKQSNAACLLPHHTNKSGASRQEDRIGNMDISRGASGIVNKARIAKTLINASNEDCERYGLSQDQRTSYVRLDDAKMNLAGPGGTPTWFERTGVRLLNGDIVGAMSLTELHLNTSHLPNRLHVILTSTMLANNTGFLPIVQAAAVIKEQEPLWANKSDTEIRNRLEGLFTNAVEYEGRTIQVLREVVGKTSTVKVVLT